jgi:hypothetical protein
MPSTLPVIAFRPSASEEKILSELASDLGVSKSRALGLVLQDYQAIMEQAEKKPVAERPRLLRLRSKIRPRATVASE